MATALDPELVLNLCKDFQGYDGVVKYLAEKGLLNPRTKKPYTKALIRYTAKKAKGYKAWRGEREKERKDTLREFTRIAKRRLSGQKESKA